VRAFSIFKCLTALILVLLFAISFTVYAQTPVPPLSSIHFVGVTYDLAIDESEEGFVKLHYRPEARQQHNQYPELILEWYSDEFIFDTFDAKSCPQLKDEPIFSSSSKDPSWFVTYRACNEIYDVRDEKPGVIHVQTNEGEILLVSIITGGDREQREFVKLTFSKLYSCSYSSL